VPVKRQFLEPIDRVSEVLFGLIMVLTFTGSLSAAEAGHADVRSMLIAALGCNLAWGIIDGVMYLMGCLAAEGRERSTLGALRAAADPDAARQALTDALPSFVASVARPEELDALGERLKAQPEPASGPTLGKGEWLGALAVLLWVFVVTFPVALPFLFVSEPQRALRLSNAVALVLLYMTGHALGRITGHRRWLTGLAMVAVGSVLVALTIALGG
jgi:VIT1/CCC1 family predicted Fe2+/Mn2+ transporter